MKKKITALVLALILLCSFVPVFAETDEGEKAAGGLDYVVKLVDFFYYKETNFQEWFQESLKNYLTEHPERMGDVLSSMLGTLDENSAYLNEGASAEMDILQSGEICGIGITVGEKGEGLLVNSTIPDGPAERAGIKAGDVIMKIDGQSVAHLTQNECISLLRGEKGTEVQVSVFRTTEAELLVFDLIRSPVHPVEVSSAMVAEDIGYMRLYSFTTGVYEDFEEQRASLKEQGATKLILDLRDNLGGVTTEAMLIANAFLPEDAVIMTETYREPEETRTYTADGTGEDWEVVVLINRNTASASEILCGALKCNGIATVLGQRSYGKASMQMRYPLNDTESVKITVGHYLLPDDSNIHGVGITPDEIIKNRTRPVNMDEDFKKLDINRRLTVGDEGDDVYAVEEYLDAMGYGTGEVDGVFDVFTEQAVWSFQRENSLFPYGVADFNTQLKMYEVLEGYEILEDRQFERAVEILSEK